MNRAGGWITRVGEAADGSTPSDLTQAEGAGDRLAAPPISARKQPRRV